MTTATLRLLATSAMLATLAACSGGPARPKNAPPPRVVLTPAETDAAFDLLMAGKERDARKLIDKLLRRDPMSATAQLLHDSVKGDPKDLLGPTSFPYTVRAGDTLGGVTQRFLGNRLKAYQLLRYNGLRAPVVLTPGQVLRIPGEPPRIEPVRRPEASPRPPAAPATPVVRAPKPKPVPAKPAANPAAPATNPAAAVRARAAGLAALNGGKVNSAVALLRRAASLDPANPAIGRDLARAERIAATVRARK